MTQKLVARNPYDVRIPTHLTIDENDVSKVISSFQTDGIIPDITVTEDGELIEGIEALEAAKRLEQQMVMVVVASRSTSKLATAFTKLNIDLIDTHPLNTSLYGENEDLSQLKKAIEITGRIKPILVTPKNGCYTAICGNSCLKVARALGYKEVQVEVVHFDNEFDEIRALLAGNVGREKSIEQKVREGWLWEKIEREEAKARMLAGKNDPRENFPQGRTTDAVAQKVGLGSGKNYEHASKAVSVLDETASAPAGSQEHKKHQELKQILSRPRGVDAAYKLAKVSTGEYPRGAFRGESDHGDSPRGAFRINPPPPDKFKQKWIPRPFERVKIIDGPHKGKLATVTIVLTFEVMAHIDGMPDEKRENIPFRCLEPIVEAKTFTSVTQETAAKQKEMGFGTRSQLFKESDRNEGHSHHQQLPASIISLNSTDDVLVTEIAIALLKLTAKQLFEVMSKVQPDLTTPQIEAVWKALEKSLAHKAA